VFDIDGVLADVGHRLAYVERRPKDWKAFFAAAPLDPPLREGRLIMRKGRDFRPAARAKPDLLAELARGRVVAVVVDDDDAVCQAYAALGYRVLRATWAEPSATLVRVQDQDGRT